LRALDALTRARLVEVVWIGGFKGVIEERTDKRSISSVAEGFF
jgi:hypothetical protein